MSLASMLQIENKYRDLTILCLEHSIPLLNYDEPKIQEFHNTRNTDSIHCI